MIYFQLFTTFGYKNLKNSENIIHDRAGNGRGNDKTLIGISRIDFHANRIRFTLRKRDCAILLRIADGRNRACTAGG